MNIDQEELALILWEIQQNQDQTAFLEILPICQQHLKQGDITILTEILTLLQTFVAEIIYNEPLINQLRVLTNHHSTRIRFSVGTLLAAIYHTKREFPLIHGYIYHYNIDVRKGAIFFYYKHHRTTPLAKPIYYKIRDCLEEETKPIKEYSAAILANHYFHNQDWTHLQNLVSYQPKERIGRFVFYEMQKQGELQAENLYPALAIYLENISEPAFSPYVASGLEQLIRNKEEYASEIETKLSTLPPQETTNHLLKICREMHLIPPIPEMAWYREGDRQREEKDYATAIQSYRNVLYINPENSGALLNLTFCLSCTNQYHQAEQTWQTYQTIVASREQGNSTEIED